MTDNQGLTQPAPIPVVANAVLATFHILANAVLYLVIPLWLLPRDPAWGLLIVPLIFLTNPFWSLLHEAIHDLLFPHRGFNGFVGRCCAVLFGAPWPILRLSHLLHHKLNRTPAEGTELFDANRSSARAAAPGYFFQILGGLYLVEAASSLLFWLPRAWLEWIEQRQLAPGSVSALLFHNWLRRETLWTIRCDGLAVMLLWYLSFRLYGEMGWLLLSALAGRAFLISFLDNIYHYATPVGDLFFARNLTLPSFIQKALLNFNLHGIHHLNPALPWRHLPQGLVALEGEYAGGYFGAAMAQLAGPIALQELSHFPGTGAVRDAS